MLRNTFTCGAALSLALGVAGLLNAQQSPTTDRQSGGDQRRQEGTPERSQGRDGDSKEHQCGPLMGSQVQLRDGTDFGQVADVTVGRDGKIEMIIVRYRDRYVAVPWEAAKLNVDDRTLQLQLDASRLSDVPTFATYPEMARGDYTKRVHTFFKTESRNEDKSDGTRKHDTDDKSNRSSKSSSSGNKRSDQSGTSAPSGKTEEPRRDGGKKQ